MALPPPHHLTHCLSLTAISLSAPSLHSLSLSLPLSRCRVTASLCAHSSPIPLRAHPVCRVTALPRCHRCLISARVCKLNSSTVCLEAGYLAAERASRCTDMYQHALRPAVLAVLCFVLLFPALGVGSADSSDAGGLKYSSAESMVISATRTIHGAVFRYSHFPGACAVLWCGVASSYYQSSRVTDLQMAARRWKWKERCQWTSTWRR